MDLGTLLKTKLSEHSLLFHIHRCKLFVSHQCRMLFSDEDKRDALLSDTYFMSWRCSGRGTFNNRSMCKNGLFSS